MYETDYFRLKLEVPFMAATVIRLAKLPSDEPRKVLRTGPKALLCGILVLESVIIAATAVGAMFGNDQRGESAFIYTPLYQGRFVAIATFLRG